MGGMWVKRILDDLKVPFSSPIKVVCDNKSVIFSALDLIQHGRMKHVDIDRHFIKEKIDSGIICRFKQKNKEHISLVKDSEYLNLRIYAVNLGWKIFIYRIKVETK